MDDTAFKMTAAADINDLHVDADELLSGVYRRHRRHQRRRLLGAAAGACAAMGLVVGALASDTPHADDASETGERVMALAPYTVSATDDAPPLAVVDGVELTYLPAGVPTEPSIESGPYVGADGNDIPGGTAVSGCFSEDACQAAGMNVSVTRSEGLDLDGYLRTNWVDDNATETTVDGRPALALDVDADEAARIVWSPQDGIVLEIVVDTSQAEELRRVIDGIRIP